LLETSLGGGISPVIGYSEMIRMERLFAESLFLGAALPPAMASELRVFERATKGI
jgi:hypothetical protein